MRSFLVLLMIKWGLFTIHDLPVSDLRPTSYAALNGKTPGVQVSKELAAIIRQSRVIVLLFSLASYPEVCPLLYQLGLRRRRH
jgi:hypothetical protein